MLLRSRPVAALLVLAAAAPATTLTRTTTADLIRKARRVTCARCESVEVRRDPASGVIFTYVRLALLEDLKGRSDAGTIQLRIVGGRIKSRAMRVAGMPRFFPGEESVLMLGRRNRAGFPVILQGRRGVLPLGRDRRGRRFLRVPVTGVSELRDRRRPDLDAFRGAVRRLARLERSR